jgi:hypothetical protein
MASLMGSIRKLVGGSSLSDDEVREILKDHELRIKELEKEVDRLGTASEKHAASVEKKFKELAKKGQAAKKQTTDDLKQLQSELETLIGALDIVIAGELAELRKREIKDLMKVAKSHRTRINKVIESRAGIQ